mmetsp:Transcript_33840/g.101915  ORF Transcript_33840/g.101915 Transcript_33840/m.101915 type:complete len:490 (-) Transcript_33840:1577-3046(-)
MVGQRGRREKRPDAETRQTEAARVHQRRLVHARRGVAALDRHGRPDDARAPVPQEAVWGRREPERHVADRPVRPLEHAGLVAGGRGGHGVAVLGPHGLPRSQHALRPRAEVRERVAPEKLADGRLRVGLARLQVAGRLRGRLRRRPVRHGRGRLLDVDKFRRRRRDAASQRRPAPPRLQPGLLGRHVRPGRPGAGGAHAHGPPALGLRHGLPVPERGPVVPQPGQARALHQPERVGERVLFHADHLHGVEEQEQVRDVRDPDGRHHAARRQRAQLLERLLHVAPGAEAPGALRDELPGGRAPVGSGDQHDGGGSRPPDGVTRTGRRRQLDGFVRRHGRRRDAPRRHVGDRAPGRDGRLRAAHRGEFCRSRGRRVARHFQIARSRRVEGDALQLQRGPGLPEHDRVRGDDGRDQGLLRRSLQHARAGGERTRPPPTGGRRRRLDLLRHIGRAPDANHRARRPHEVASLVVSQQIQHVRQAGEGGREGVGQ